MFNCASTPTSRSTSATPTHPGNAAPTKTPTDCCASTTPKAPTCPCTAPTTSPTSPTPSMAGHARPSASTPQPKPSPNYCQQHKQPVLQRPVESASPLDRVAVQGSAHGFAVEASPRELGPQAQGSQPPSYECRSSSFEP